MSLVGSMQIRRLRSGAGVHQRARPASVISAASLLAS